VGFELRRYFDDFDVEHVELASDIAEDEIGPRPPKIGAKLPKDVKPSVFAMRMSAFGDKADMTFRGALCPLMATGTVCVNCHCIKGVPTRTRAERWRMISATWKTIKDVVLSFISDEALTRGAAIAFYTATSIAPILLIVIAIAGIVFGQEAAQNAITSQFSDLMGHQTAEVLQSAIASAAEKSSGIIATIIGVAVLIATASGVFGEMQAALNAIWKANPQTTTVSQLIRARAVSLGLVAALGFLLIVSLAISAGLTAFGDYLDTVLPMGKLILPVLNFVVSVLLLAILFGAIYKVLPDRSLQWTDVVTGALITSVLFNVGKSLIAWYIGSSAVASSYGAAGGLIVLLLWVYYSAQIFLLGAEFTKIYANRHGSKQRKPVS
jgi:membrane protein